MHVSTPAKRRSPRLDIMLSNHLRRCRAPVPRARSNNLQILPSSGRSRTKTKNAAGRGRRQGGGLEDVSPYIRRAYLVLPKPVEERYREVLTDIIRRLRVASTPHGGCPRSLLFPSPMAISAGTITLPLPLTNDPPHPLPSSFELYCLLSFREFSFRRTVGHTYFTTVNANLHFKMV